MISIQSARAIQQKKKKKTQSFQEIVLKKQDIHM